MTALFVVPRSRKSTERATESGEWVWALNDGICAMLVDSETR